MSAHRFLIRVPYAHVDQMGFVYYANYLVYFEMARAQLLRDAGVPYTSIEKRGIMLPVVSAHCDYKKPARYDDELVVISRCSEIRGLRLRIDYEVMRSEDGEGNREQGEGVLICVGYTEHVCLGKDGKVKKLIPELQGLG